MMSGLRKKARIHQLRGVEPEEQQLLEKDADEFLDELLECASKRCLNVVVWTLPKSQAHKDNNTIPFMLPIYVQFIDPRSRCDIDVPAAAYSNDRLRREILNAIRATVMHIQVNRPMSDGRVIVYPLKVSLQDGEHFSKSISYEQRTFRLDCQHYYALAVAIQRDVS